MKSGLQVVAVIPARGGSKGIPRKNIRDLAGKPLIAYTIEAAKKAKHIDCVVVSTDDEEIARIAKLYGAEVPFLRPAELAKDETPTLPVLQHAVQFLERKGNKVDVVVTLQPTSPLRGEKEIDETIETFLKTDADSVVSVCEVKTHPFWMFKIEGDRLIPFSKRGVRVTKRQSLPKLYALNGAVYVAKREVLMKENSMYGKDIRAIVMSEEKSIDIDSLFDLFIAEMIIKKRYGLSEESKDRR